MPSFPQKNNICGKIYMLQCPELSVKNVLLHLEKNLEKLDQIPKIIILDY